MASMNHGRCQKFFFVLSALSYSAAGLVTTSSASERPNIVVIVSDDAGYNEFGFTNALTGYPTTHAVTPNIDALASQSVVARQGYVSSPLCHPSRVGLLTGQYSQRFQREDNLPNTITNPFGLKAGQQLLSHHLQGLGYSTGAVGKWHLGFQDGVNRPQDQGFDEFYGFLGGSRNYYYDLVTANRMRRGDTDIENIWKTEGDPTKYDPVQGRYVTDAFGEEAVDFINRHAGEEDPFFLYVAFTAPHTPWAVKQSDYNHLSHITNARERESAAMIYAMDRAVGDITGALAAHGIDDNTIVVFVNDNGGPTFGGHYNQPFVGFKGYTFEGGIRVPFTIKMPGVDAGTYDAPITTLDLLPTLVAAAGGDISEIPADGVDLTPHLTGENSDRPHELMFWRNRTIWAVRKGDWKLCRPNEPQLNFYALLDLKNDPYETTNRLNAEPAIAADLYREFTYWEATLPKPESANFGTDNRNRFDHFVFRNDQAATTDWNAAGAWHQAETTNAKTMFIDDAYANAILEFTTKDSSNYTATNNMTRMSGLTFMANQLRLTGQFNGTSNQTGTINGNTLLLVKSLTGVLPHIQLDATSGATSAQFGFRIFNRIELLDDLVIDGNGTQDFSISGPIVDYYEPRNVVKRGSSTVVLLGDNRFRGTFSIEAGSVRVAGTGGAIDGAASIDIGSNGQLTLENGKINVQTLENFAGGAFHFQGGRLSVANVIGDLSNTGGTYAPVRDITLNASTISGDFSQTNGITEIEIGGTASILNDQLLVGGSASLGGTLRVLLTGGYNPAAATTFSIISAAGGIEGEFDTILAPSLSGGLTWNVLYNANSVQLRAAVGLEGDFNLDGRVDAADYVAWKKGLGTQYTSEHYNLWRSNFGAVAAQGFGGGPSAVPEPATLAMFCWSAAVGWGMRRRGTVVPKSRSVSNSPIRRQWDSFAIRWLTNVCSNLLVAFRSF